MKYKIVKPICIIILYIYIYHLPKNKNNLADNVLLVDVKK